VDSLPATGWRDLRRRVRIGWLLLQRSRLRKALFEAETELGWLGWEQVDFFDPRLTEQVRKVQEFENAQATLLNTSAELSGRKNELAQTFAQQAGTHDQTQESLAAERAPLAASLSQSEVARRQKLEALERFQRALDEITKREKQLEARSLALMAVGQPDIQTRIEAREVSDELGQLAGEKKLVAADKVNAMREAETLEAVIGRARTELKRIDAAAAAARDTLADARAGHDSETRMLDRERKKSSLHMAHLDKEKRRPYRIIGAALADDRISPLNQPDVLTKVYELRAKVTVIEGDVDELRAACSAMDRGILVTFYLLLLAVLFMLSLFMGLALHRG
jgi:chromosome segregation ATPase